MPLLGIVVEHSLDGVALEFVDERRIVAGMIVAETERAVIGAASVKPQPTLHSTLSDFAITLRQAALQHPLDSAYVALPTPAVGWQPEQRESAPIENRILHPIPFVLLCTFLVESPGIDLDGQQRTLVHLAEE